MSSPPTSSRKRNKAFNDNWVPPPCSSSSKDPGLVIVVTGATSGLGTAVVKRFSEMVRGRRARFFLVGRRVDVGLGIVAGLRRADEEFREGRGGGVGGEEEEEEEGEEGEEGREGGRGGREEEEERYTFIQSDLSLMSDVHTLSSTIKKQVDKVNYLVHSAGTYDNTGYGAHPTPGEKIESGELAGRYYARFRLTFELMEELRRGAAGEGEGGGGGGGQAGVMTILGTGMPFLNRIDLDDLGFHKHYGFALKVMFHSGVYNDLWITVSLPSSSFFIFYFGLTKKRNRNWQRGNQPSPSPISHPPRLVRAGSQTRDLPPFLANCSCSSSLPSSSSSLLPLRIRQKLSSTPSSQPKEGNGTDGRSEEMSWGRRRFLCWPYRVLESYFGSILSKRLGVSHRYRYIH